MSGNRYVFAQAQNITITTTSDTTEYGTVKSLSGAFSVSGANSAVANAFLADTTATSIFGSNGPTITSTGYLSGTQTNSVSGGPYTITASGGTPVNGSTISFQNSGTLTIGQRSLTVTADAQSRAYGASNPALTYTVGGSGLVNGDTLTGALSTSATTASNVGSYTIGQDTLAASSNYALTYVSANLGVTPAPLTVTGTVVGSKIYDGSLAGGIVTVGTLSGFVGTETVTASGLATLSSPNVGTQMATVAYRLRDGTNGGLALNYSLVNSTGLSATVTARPLTASEMTDDAYLIALLNERLYALGVRIGFSTLLTSADLSQNAYSRAVKIADSTGTISNFSIAQIGREPVFIPFVTSIQKTPRIGAF